MAKRPCSELAATVTQLAMHVGARPEVKSLADVVTHLEKELPGITREILVNSINEATTGHRAAKTELQDKLGKLKGEARGDVTLRRAITKYETALKGGTLPPKTPRTVAEPPAEIASLREARDNLQSALAKSEPALREKYTKQIEDLTQRLEDGVEVPGPKIEPLRTKELDRLTYERDRLRSEIRQRINDLKPKTIWQRAGSAVAEPINAMRSTMTSFDFSAVLRQGAFIGMGNPIRAARLLKPMFQAFRDPAVSHKINSDLLNPDVRENAPAYARSGLYLAPDGEASLSAKEEAFMSKWADKIPGVAGSQRAYVTYLNLLRADSFDAMVATLARDGSATEPEMQAIANFINAATGRGNLGSGKIEKAAPLLNTVFFAPRYVASRFQLMAGEPMYGGTMRTRKLVAQEYAKFLAGLGVTYTLGMMAGGQLENDPKSADFGKIRFGDTRLDPLAGLAQGTTLVARIISGKRTDKNGKVTVLDGKGKYNTRGTVLQDFARSKMSPVVGATYDWAYNETPDRKEFKLSSAAKNLVLPMQVETMLETFEAQGVPKATALGILSIFGMGVNTYK